MKITPAFLRLFLAAGMLWGWPLCAHANTGNSLDCRIEPSVVVALSSSVVGVVSQVLVDKNSAVEKGMVVAHLEAGVETATLELRKLQSELTSEIATGRYQLNLAQRNLDRITDLYSQKAASFAELDKAKTEHLMATEQLQQAIDRKKQAEMEYKRAQADLKKRTLTSPISGIVIERLKQPGEHIDYEPAIKIAQLNPLKVEVFAPAALYGKIKNGMKAQVTPSLLGFEKPLTAEVILVDQTIDALSNTFGIRLSIPNPNNSIPSGLKCAIQFPNISLNLLDLTPAP